MSFLSRLFGKGNPSIIIWVRDQNPDEILLTTLLIRLKDENLEQIPQVIRDMLDKKIPYKNIRFKKQPNALKGGTDVTCIFEQ